MDHIPSQRGDPKKSLRMRRFSYKTRPNFSIYTKPAQGEPYGVKSYARRHLTTLCHVHGVRSKSAKLPLTTKFALSVQYTGQVDCFGGPC